MTLLTWLGGGLSALLFIYLMYALLYPENMS
jgi:K+-transporting ATPase KdpF subunit